MARKNGRGNPPSTLTQNMLYAKAAGRCQFEGCNKPVLFDELTLREYNKSNVAHIVASSPKGARGDAIRSHQLSDKLSMVLYNLLGGAISFAEPSGLLLDHWFLTIHALMWHMLLVFIGLFICFSKRGGNLSSDYWDATWTFIALCGVAFALNCFVQLGLGKHMNMFFVGPGNSPIIVFKQFSEWFGWYINTPIYIFAVCLGAYLVSLLIGRLQNRNSPIHSN